jgi:hypothetical protein
MGDVIKPNLAILVEVMQSVTVHDKLKVALLGPFCQLGFIGVL